MASECVDYTYNINTVDIHHSQHQIYQNYNNTSRQSTDGVSDEIACVVAGDEQ